MACKLETKLDLTLGLKLESLWGSPLEVGKGVLLVFGLDFARGLMLVQQWDSATVSPLVVE